MFKLWLQVYEEETLVNSKQKCFCLRIKSGQTLHACFKGLVSIFRGKLKKENCSSMGLGASLKISASYD